MQHTHAYTQTSDYRLYLPGFNRILTRMMSDESLSLDARIHLKSRFNTYSAGILIMLAEQAIQNGEFDKVSEIAEILTRFGNQKAEALLLVGRAKLKELSEPAFFLVNRTFRDPAYFLIGEIKRSLWSIFPTRETNKKTLKKQLSLKRLQKQYGENLHYIDKYTR
jgi:hypothetical protein